MDPRVGEEVYVVGNVGWREGSWDVSARRRDRLDFPDALGETRNVEGCIRENGCQLDAQVRI